MNGTKHLWQNWILLPLWNNRTLRKKDSLLRIFAVHPEYHTWHNSVTRTVICRMRWGAAMPPLSGRPSGSRPLEQKINATLSKIKFRTPTVPNSTNLNRPGLPLSHLTSDQRQATERPAFGRRRYLTEGQTAVPDQFGTAHFFSGAFKKDRSS